MPRYAANPTGSIQRPDPFTRASFTAFARVFLGPMWLIEVTIGENRRGHVVLWIVASLTAFTALVAAFVTGVEPGEYEVSMPAVSAVMVSMFSGLVAATEYLRLRAVTPITSADALQRLDTRG